ncbi:export control protein CHS7-like protein [Thermochaetoides thermophila DSM 1495]|uniref:Export control protein CHS7-like protein n=1 Tax=Chaetomium thermophilum (strain DSM 1495 / CBS 144.50 / IMI 039719) TaxID=759272 RepID=G0RZF8_CHATD|nr:export control protein CHS7-like protein [Thermochaetoides thermophila DSM 1495]EGS23586.1 export control protein CHS7-like protein [Thermochaetoides thermophila DSM 1495]
MGSTKFGNFDILCRDTTLPICNLISPFHNQTGPWDGCSLKGIPLSGGRHLGNLGTILLCGAAIATTIKLLVRSERKRAAVGRSAIHIGAIAATTWILFINAVIGYQLMDDGTPLSVFLTGGSGLVFLIGVGYIALDTGFQFTDFWNDSYNSPNRHIALYVLYLIVPLLWIVLYVVLESYLVLKILGEIRPMFFLLGSAFFFAAGQVFNFAVSSHICEGTSGRIDGSLFQTFFTLLSVVAVWLFWSEITEDDWQDNITPYP